MSKQTTVGIIGCGLIGKKRAAALPPNSLRIVCDLDLKAAEHLARNYPNCRATNQASEVFESDLEMVIVATRNDSLAALTIGALNAGKHVLVEKPAAISVAQVIEVEECAKKNNKLVRVGFNHRYHPAFQKAREVLDALGPLMFIRGRYGHGGRVGYEKEWRADPKLSGGGELIDQGVHLIDLAGWFLGDFSKIIGSALTYFWDMQVDDNAFLHLETADRKTAWLQVSCTEWKNLFSFEIYGKNAKLHIEGLGGSYGTERLSVYKMLPQMGPPETTIFEYPRGDNSWELEIAAFLEDIELGRTPEPGLREAHAALDVVERIYSQSEPIRR